jgi:hypothetical protein
MSVKSVAESPRFDPRSVWSCLLRCQLASSMSTGAAVSELNYLCCQKSPFLADSAVIRTRQFASKTPVCLLDMELSWMSRYRRFADAY